MPFKQALNFWGNEIRRHVVRNMINWELSGELFEVCDVALESRDDIPVEQFEVQGVEHSGVDAADE